LEVAKVGERLTVSRQAAQKTDMDRFNLKKLNRGDVKEQYTVTIRKTLQLGKTEEQCGHQQGMGQY
jgi:hypothetical protein